MRVDELTHYGTPRHSGRYPWGSGQDPEQRGTSWLGKVNELRRQGLSEVEIAKGEGMSVSELRSKKSIARVEQRKADTAEALRLKDKGYSNIAIGSRMGINESSVRALLNPAIQERADIAATTSKMLKDAVEKNKYIDVGAGIEQHLGISRTKLNTSLSMLEEEGYEIHKIQVQQQFGKGKTTIRVLTPSGISSYEIYKNSDKIKIPTDYSEDGGRSFKSIKTPQNVDSKRIMVRYAEDGGKDKDGVIELRRNVDDINLGNARFAQVRIAVDGTHYMKGMAMYSDNVPSGFDIIYNTNKPSGSGKDVVFKPMKDDPDNPFGSSISRQNGALNIVNEEGGEHSWSTWSRNISSQVLSKQNVSLAKKQLELAYNLKSEEFDELLTLTNPAVKKRLLESFADDCDSAAVHLKAAALPRQATHVILPLTSIKENEIYAPNYLNGESVVLIRHPHGGTFEIPELIVNNKNPEANRLIKNTREAVGINPKVADRLSGADFDGDTVLVIPNRDKLIKVSDRLKGLKDFDDKISYKPYDGMTTIDGGIYHEKTGTVDYGGKPPRSKTMQMKMGDVSNLITDMTIKGANSSEICRAVRHSMVVIDSEKHHLNYKQSYIDNNIADLKKRYQGGARAGASTIISRASAEIRVPFRKERGTTITPRNTDIRTGKKIYEYAPETFVNKKGKIVPRTTLSTRMAEAENAFTLSSGSQMETAYATHANALKTLANKSRKVSLETEDTPYSPSAKVTYQNEVSSLRAKLNIALKNKPLERQAQLLANKVVTAKRQSNPGMETSDIKKIKGQALEEARNRTGAGKKKIMISDKEWEAIQSGAISNNTLVQILHNTDVDALKRRALPRAHKVMSSAKIARAHSMLEAGYTQAEVANALGVSTSALDSALK